ncbi:uncharacterized protein LOC123519639 [Portunus trituberculatus]|uniref:uncharacterized protein LOC123519639 n=1 Tax=Portunus trituberculatus TaxID=210409 RepID=UPI001E1D1C27|nr:uncharacterized protein LOC123519639 [Portunus trituberculatus]
MSMLLPLLALLVATLPATAEMNQVVWHRALVSQAQLDAATMSESFQVSDEILCAALANNSPRCHLLTYEGTTCVLYDVAVDSLDAAPDATTPCRTRHRNVCFVDGVPVSHGTKVEQECFTALCWNRAVIPYYAASTTCDGDFVQDALGCVYLHQVEMTWCDARQHCATLGADLATVSASEFPALQAFLEASASGVQVWVGATFQKWLDGRDVAGEEWGSGEPNGPLDDCVRMKRYNGMYKLYDNGCSNAFTFLCRRPI